MEVICVCTPLYQGYLREAAEARIELPLRWPQVAPEDWLLRTHAGRGQPVDHVRRIIVRAVLQDEPGWDGKPVAHAPWLTWGAATVIVFADHDVSFGADDVVRLSRTLLEHDDVAVVVAPMPQQESAHDASVGTAFTALGGLTLNVNPGVPPLTPFPLPWDRPFEIRNGGFGMVAIRASVFSKVPRPWFDFVEHEDADGRFHLSGEDMGFCDKVRAQGFRVLCEPRVRPFHTFLRTFTLEDAHHSVLLHLSRRAFA